MKKPLNKTTYRMEQSLESFAICSCSCTISCSGCKCDCVGQPGNLADAAFSTARSNTWNNQFIIETSGVVILYAHGECPVR